MPSSLTWNSRETRFHGKKFGPRFRRLHCCFSVTNLPVTSGCLQTSVSIFKLGIPCPPEHTEVFDQVWTGLENEPCESVGGIVNGLLIKPLFKFQAFALSFLLVDIAFVLIAVFFYFNIKLCCKGLHEHCFNVLFHVVFILANSTDFLCCYFL